MPSARYERAKKGRLGSAFVEMERLRIKLFGEILDLLRVEGMDATAEALVLFTS